MSLTPEQLRRACDAAEIPLRPWLRDGFRDRWKWQGEDRRWYFPGAFFLRPYLASLLVAKAKDKPGLPSILFPADPKHWSENELTLCLFGATDEQRTRAAYKALTGEEL